MSNHMAIAAVTETIRNILVLGFKDFNVPGVGNVSVKVSMVPPDKAHASAGENVLNIFLYQVAPNAAYRNQSLPLAGKPGEISPPPLALDLHYLLTAYGRNDDNSEPLSHHLLGRAMSVLHDYPVFNRERIRLSRPESMLHQQFERIRFTPDALSIEDLSKLWATFQTGYRISVAYLATVVLIDSNLPTKAAPPVLARNTPDDSPSVAPAIPSFPMLTRVRPLDPNLLSAGVGDRLELLGDGLEGDNLRVEIAHPLMTPALSITAESHTASGVLLLLPPAIGDWPAGYSTITAIIERSGRSIRSNDLPLAVAPAITLNLNNASAPQIRLTVNVTPRLRPEQRVSLLLGDREVPSPKRTAVTGSITFDINGVEPGVYLVRLRVDGVDSIPYERSGEPPVLRFADDQKVTVTA